MMKIETVLIMCFLAVVHSRNTPTKTIQIPLQHQFSAEPTTTEAPTEAPTDPSTEPPTEPPTTLPPTKAPSTDATETVEIKLAFSNLGCVVSGLRYFEGQYIPYVGGVCTSCYCLKGKPQCEDIECKGPPRSGCTAVTREGVCCPLSYNCEDQEAAKKRPASRGNILSVRQSIFDILGINPARIGKQNEEEIPINQVRLDRQSRLNDVPVTEEIVVEEVTELMRSQDESSSPLKKHLPAVPDAKKSSNMNFDDGLTREKPDASEPLAEPEPAPEPEPEPTTQPDPTPEPIAEPEPEPSSKSESESFEKSTSDVSSTPKKEIGLTKGEPAEQTQEPSAEPEPSSDDNTPADEATETPSPTTTLTNGNEAILNMGLSGKSELSENEAIAIQELPRNPALDVDPTRFDEIATPDDYDYLLEDYSSSDPDSPIKDNTLVYDETPLDQDFPSYDISVGTSLVAGDRQPPRSPLGVGQVIPVDLDGDTSDSHSSPSGQPAPSLLDSFLNFFATNARRQDEEAASRPFEHPPRGSVALPNPLPPSGMSPPPAHISNRPITPIGTSFIVTDTEDNEERPAVASRVPPSRNTLPIRRPPADGRPLRPGVFAGRPIGLLPPSGRPSPGNNALFPVLPSEPVVEDGFTAIKREQTEATLSNEERVTGSIPDQDAEETGQPTLPPSLPNLMIIPFMASDAVKNKKSGMNPEDFRSTTNASPSEADDEGSCREGGRQWNNGQTIARSDDDPCKICTCNNGEISCKKERCPSPPPGCIRVKPKSDQCCPKIVCPEEEEQTTTARPSFHRPSPGSRRPPAGTRRTPPIRRPPFSFRKPQRPQSTEVEVPTTSRTAPTPRRPLIGRPRPSSRPKPATPPRRPANRNDLPPIFSRPFAHRNRTGSRPPFVPPRRTGPRPSRPTSSESAKEVDEPEIPTETPITVSSVPEKSSETKLADDIMGLFDGDDDFLPSNLLLPRPISSTKPKINDDVLNFVLQDKFRIPPSRETPNALIEIQSTTRKPQTTTTTKAPLPSIPESVKAQVPLGNDPLLALGFFELAGCNVYGRMFDIGNSIKELSSECKECRCTRVGVQCLPKC